MRQQVLNIKKYLRIYRIFFNISFSEFLSHRFNALMGAIASILWTVTQVIGLQFLFEKITLFNGWGFYDLVLLLGFGQLMFYSLVIFYDGNFSQFAKILIRGEFDRYLTRPMNIKFFISFQRIILVQIIPLVLTVAPIIIWGLGHQNIQNWFNVIAAFTILFVGLIIFYFLELSVVGIYFFIENIESVKEVLLNGSMDFNRVPLNMLPNGIRLIFTLIVPVAFISFYPVLLIKGEVQFLDVLIVEIFILMFFILLSKLVWDKGIKHYSGVS